jgi:hypothetical protein
MIRRAALIVAAYAALTVVMTWPFVNYSDFARPPATAVTRV